MEDEVGLVNVIIYPDLYQRTPPGAWRAVSGGPGKLQKKDGTINIMAHKIASLEGAREQFNAPRPDAYEDVFPEQTVTKKALQPASHNYR
ncbi:MAG: hypothetical protein R2839_11345 [Thermomicrobiales bacterium]